MENMVCFSLRGKNGNMEARKVAIVYNPGERWGLKQVVVVGVKWLNS